jgi:hypothetical protein
MKDPRRTVTLKNAEIERLELEYIQMSENVLGQAAALWVALELSREKPEQFDELKSRSDMMFEGLRSQLDSFRDVLYATLELNVRET